MMRGKKCTLAYVVIVNPLWQDLVTNTTREATIVASHVATMKEAHFAGHTPLDGFIP